MKAAEIGPMLVSLRVEAGLTQAEVARRMGTTQSSVARAETDWRRLPSLDFLDRYARATGRSMQIILGGPAATPEAIGQTARKALGAFEFDPWRRSPSPAERRSLLKDGIRPVSRTREATRRRSPARS
jgi:transcriptional regulator with XRE-family HTH domain